MVHALILHWGIADTVSVQNADMNFLYDSASAMTGVNLTHW